MVGHDEHNIDVIDQWSKITDITEKAARKIEKIGRVCYNSEDKIILDSEESCHKFIDGIFKNKHYSVLEHAVATVKMATNRGVSHEIVRHRIASFSQSSTRYINHTKKPFVIIRPVWFQSDCKELNKNIKKAFEFVDKEGIDYLIKAAWSNLPLPEEHWVVSNIEAYFNYREAIMIHDWQPQQARDLLNHATATTLYMTANFREWLLVVFELRCASAAHPQMRDLMLKLHTKFKKACPIIFDRVKFD